MSVRICKLLPMCKDNKMEVSDIETLADLRDVLGTKKVNAILEEFAYQKYATVLKEHYDKEESEISDIYELKHLIGAEKVDTILKDYFKTVSVSELLNIIDNDKILKASISIIDKRFRRAIEVEEEEKE